MGTKVYFVATKVFRILQYLKLILSLLRYFSDTINNTYRQKFVYVHVLEIIFLNAKLTRIKENCNIL